MNRQIFRDLDYLFSLGNFGIRPGLQNIELAMRRMDFPNLKVPAIHFAGTNGKGSSLKFLERMLIDSGYRVCSTLSPHLISFCERFRLQGRDISEASLNESYLRVLDACGIDDTNFHDWENWPIPLTFFELAIAIAFDFFAREKPDVALIETGMGGRLDATNVCKSIVHAITSVSLDHTQYLGVSLPEIAREKAGIIRSASPTFCSRQNNSEVAEIIAEKCKQTGSVLQIAEEEIQKKEQFGELSFFEKEQPILSIRKEEVPLQGNHQYSNLNLALAIYRHFCPPEKRLTKEDLAKSVRNVRHPGRLQKIPGFDRLLIDGAHNFDGVSKLLEYLTENFLNQKILFCISWIAGKEILKAFQVPFLFEAKFYPVEIKNGMGVPEKQMRRELRSAGLSLEDTKTLKNPMEKIQRGDFNHYDLIVICGSLYFAGEILEEIETLKNR